MKSQSPLLKQAIGLAVGLCVQYILGMAINLYVTFPKSNDVRSLWEYARAQPLVMAHIIFGTLLLIGSIAITVRAFKSENHTWKTCTVLGLVAILTAWVSGERFISTQNDAYSLSMAIGFILGILAYAWGIFSSLNHS